MMSTIQFQAPMIEDESGWTSMLGLTCLAKEKLICVPQVPSLFAAEQPESVSKTSD